MRVRKADFWYVTIHVLHILIYLITASNIMYCDYLLWIVIIVGLELWTHAYKEWKPYKKSPLPSLMSRSEDNPDSGKEVLLH